MLRAGDEVIDPWNRKLKPANVILLEEPFGRLREGMEEIADFVACMDLPLDLAI
ncbi:hypothetical protein M6D81_30605 [Paenibacillus sp. J5C_2022]|nr:hypothetical protein [Paenibacillus sp. J5C2022]